MRDIESRQVKFTVGLPLFIIPALYRLLECLKERNPEEVNLITSEKVLECAALFGIVEMIKVYDSENKKEKPLDD